MSFSAFGNPYKSNKVNRLLDNVKSGDTLKVTTGFSDVQNSDIHSWVSIFYKDSKKPVKVEVYRLDNPAITQVSVARHTAKAEAVRFTDYIKGECERREAYVFDANYSEIVKSTGESEIMKLEILN